jgi:pyruvate-formate lyase-activating enzyme
MRLEGRLRIAPRARRGRFCVIPIFTAFRDLSQELTILADGLVLAAFPLMKGWNKYTLALPDVSGDLVLTLRVDKLTPAASHPIDLRDLGIRVGALAFHDDDARQERELFIQENLARSQRELQEGATVLTSFPSSLGVDLYGKCNISPACVYCLWDRMKDLEGANVNAVIDDRTLESYGPFFSSVLTLVNCSFGEPLLHPRLEQILDLIERHGKTVELSSNGQAFTARTVRALSGRPVHLYVSLDAASAETYARLRNEQWDEILSGLLFLREARRRGGGRPLLNMVFMPMRANRQDLEAYFKLCRLVEADALVLRPLLRLEDPDIVTERGGYRFDYERELLGRDELETILVDAGRFAEQYDVNVRSQFDFGKIDPQNVRARWRATQ